MEERDFYKKEFFDLMCKRFDSLEEGLNGLKSDVDIVKEKVTWITAIASGVGALAGLFFAIVKDKIVSVFNA